MKTLKEFSRKSLLGVMSNKDNKIRGFDKFTIDGEKRVLLYENEPIDMSVKAVELLFVLIESEGEVVSKDELLNKVWQGSFVEESVLSQNVYLLRKTFKDLGLEEDIIKTVPRRGYYFSGRLNDSAEEEITIERNTFERTIITGNYDLKEARLLSTEKLLNAETESQAIEQTQADLPSKVQNRATRYLSLFLLPILLVGTGFIVWNYSEPNKSRFIKDFNIENLKYESLTSSGEAHFPAVSPDNEHIAYVQTVKDKFKIVLQNIATRSETAIVEPQEEVLRSINFSPDGNYLYYASYTDGIRTITQVPIYGGAKRIVVTNLAHNFSISPDGNYFAFFRFESKTNNTQLLTSKIDGSEERIIATRKAPKHFQVWGSFPSWSPNGKKIVVPAETELAKLKDNERRSYFLEIDIDTGEEKIIKSPNWYASTQAFWLANGSGFWVSAREKFNTPRQLWFLSYPDGEATRITNDAKDYREFQPSFDGSFLIGIDQTSSFNLSIASIDDPKQVQKLTSETSIYQGYRGLEWTNDGKYLVYVKGTSLYDGNLWKINLETLKTEQLTFEKDAAYSHLKISPDDKSVYFTSKKKGNWNIWKIDLDGRNLQQITNGEGELYPEISADGKWLYYTGPESYPKKLWRMLLKDKTATKLLENVEGNMKVSPTESNQLLVYHFDEKDKKDKWKYTLFSHEKTKVLERLSFYSQDKVTDWKKDGSGIYFLSFGERNNNIKFFNLKDKSTKQVSFYDDQRIVNLKVSPNGKSFALSRGTRNANILKISGFQK